MTKKFLLTLSLFVILILLLSGCQSSSPTENNLESTEVMEEEHKEENADGEEHAHVDPPPEYTDLTNPYVDDHEAIEAGKAIYEINCLACHGSEGNGDGPAATALVPKPGNLADAHMMGDLSDGYLFWRVSEGGAVEPFMSAMPAWKETLTEEQRWQVLSYVRSLSEDSH